MHLKRHSILMRSKHFAWCFRKSGEIEKEINIIEGKNREKNRERPGNCLSLFYVVQ